MSQTGKSAWDGFGRDLLAGMRERGKERLDEASFEAEIVGIEKATAALCEAGVEDEKVIQLLQKYWDLRLSEAEEYLWKEKGLKRK